MDAPRGCCLTPLSPKPKTMEVAQAPPHVTGASPIQPRFEVAGMCCLALAMRWLGRQRRAEKSGVAFRASCLPC